jgi:hypothetical protein
MSRQVPLAPAVDQSIEFEVSFAQANDEECQIAI